MNGDAQQIMNKIVEIETKQEERHVENKSDLKVIFRALAKINELPCKVHIERMKWHDRWLTILGVGIVAILGWLAKTHLVG